MSDLAARRAQVERWTSTPVSADEPCGPNLEYEPAFLQLAAAAEGKPETQHRAAEPPDWRNVEEQAAALLDRSRDLRPAVLWLRAGVRELGLAALPDGLRLLHDMLERDWAHVHPTPDPDDGDLFSRVSVLNALSAPELLLADLRACTIFSHRRVGELRGRALELALGQLTPRADEDVLPREGLQQMLGAAMAELPELAELPAAALSELARLQSVIDEQLNGQEGPDFTPLDRWLKQLRQLMPTVAGAESAAAADAAADGDESAAPMARVGSAGQSLSGRIQSRDDAIRAIDMICDYLDRTEPTNPAQLILRRARNLISRNFLQLMKELAPESLAEVARVMGVDPDSISSE
ncbi:type VI secretion system ImpA family N-terminal domain-containing protein [soil metagenome]